LYTVIGSAVDSSLTSFRQNVKTVLTLPYHNTVYSIVIAIDEKGLLVLFLAVVLFVVWNGINCIWSL